MYGDKVVVKVIAASRETSRVHFEVANNKGDNNAKKEKKTKNN